MNCEAAKPNNLKRKLIIVAGPTATGKSDSAVELALRIGGEIISADSMQVYRGMDIGTAKITPDQMKGIPHHLIDILDPHETWNVALFKEKAMEAADQILSRGKIPILCGGTGFYVQALLRDIDFTEMEEDNELRDSLAAFAAANGASALHDRLREIDPESAAAIHPNNVKRVIRAIEFYEKSGRKISEHNTEQSERSNAFDAVFFVLDRDREIRRNRIRARVETMYRDGLVTEVRKLMQEGCKSSDISMQGIGYKEIIRELEKNGDAADAKEEIIMNTIHFAKRQSTWFNREEGTIRIDPDSFPSFEAMIDYMEEIVREHFHEREQQ